MDRQGDVGLGAIELVVTFTTASDWRARPAR
jgi:hypothetical protein